MLAGGVPLLALDMYEHSYHLDFGAAAAGYVDAFMDNIDWSKVHKRYQTAVNWASEPCGAAQHQVEGAVLIDVRPTHIAERQTPMFPGARWRDPARIAEWCSELPVDREVIVYCEYGLEVGRATALRLRAAGLNARFLRGGIEGFQ